MYPSDFVDNWQWQMKQWATSESNWALCLIASSSNSGGNVSRPCPKPRKCFIARRITRSRKLAFGRMKFRISWFWIKKSVQISQDIIHSRQSRGKMKGCGKEHIQCQLILTRSTQYQVGCLFQVTNLKSHHAKWLFKKNGFLALCGKMAFWLFVIIAQNNFSNAEQPLSLSQYIFLFTISIMMLYFAQ